MTLPGGIATVQVTGEFVDPSGQPLQGRVTFTPTTDLTDPGNSVNIPAVTRAYTLSRGRFTSDALVATDNGSVTPANWAYTVTISLADLDPISYEVLLPQDASPVDLSALTPVAAQPAVSAYLTLAGGTVSGLVTLAGGLKIPGGAALGDVLTSAADGTAGWEALSVALPPATTSSQGAVQLTADLAGSAGAPHVVTTHLTSPLPFAQGGTTGGTQQTAINALTGSQSAGHYLRSDGTNASLAAIQAGDVPTLTQYPYTTNAKAFGAVGDGSHNDTTAIQAAIDATAPGGVCVLDNAGGLGTYKITAPLNLFSTTLSSPKAIRLEGWSSSDDFGVQIVPTSALGSAPAINAATQYAPGGTATQFNAYSHISNIYVNLSSAPNAVGVYYDRVFAVTETRVKVRGGQCSRVIGWANNLVFDNPVAYNSTDSFWKFLHAYSTDAAWDTFNAGNTVGGGGSTFGDPVQFVWLNPFNYITSGFGSGLVGAFWTIKAGNDFRISGGHSLRAPGLPGYVTYGINVDFSWNTGQKNCYLQYAGHQLDGIWDGTGSGPPFKSATGAVVRMSNAANYCRFDSSSWLGGYSATDQSDVWCLILVNCTDVILAAGGHYSGRGILVDGVNSQIAVRGYFPQPYSDPVISSAAAGTINSGSGGATLPVSSLAVDNMVTANVPTAGTLLAATTTGPAAITYTGWSTAGSVTTFTGCTGGTGTLAATGGTVVLKSLTQSVVDASYAGSLADNAETLGGIVQGSSAPLRTPLTVTGNTTTPALTIARAQDSLAWAWQMDNSSSGTLDLKNPSGSVAIQVSSGGLVVARLNGVEGTYLQSSGITGATATSRYVGATASGAPGSGTFILGDFTVDQTGSMWICTTAGTVGSGAVFTHLSGGITLDTTAADVANVGVQAAGSNTKAAAADHVHGSSRGGFARPGTTLGWTCPPHEASTTWAPSSGNAGFLLMFQVEMPAGGTTSNLSMLVTTAGNTLANVYTALLDSTGTFQATSVERHADSALTTNNTLWTVPWQSSYAAPAGTYWGCLLIGSATTMPTFAAGRATVAGFLNLGCTAAGLNLRAAIDAGGHSALPGSVTMSGLGTYAGAPCMVLT